MKKIQELLLVGVLARIVNQLINGFVVYKYFQWFLIPVFNFVNQPSYLQSVGLSVFIFSLLNGKELVLGEKEMDKKLEEIKNYDVFYKSLSLLLNPLTSLIIGFIFKVILSM